LLTGSQQLNKADKIIVIDKGEIKEVGNHESLLREFPDGIYSNLVSTQQTNFKNKGINSLDNDSSEGEIESIDIPLVKTRSQENSQKELEKELTVSVDKEDQLREEEIANFRTLRRKQGYFKRLCVHNKPVYFIIIGLIASIIAGTIFPIFAVFWTKILFVMMDFDNMGGQLFKY